ncbi:MAG: YaiO family outer membrane beta-barrel protein [Draconibacterium sp.]
MKLKIYTRFFILIAVWLQISGISADLKAQTFEEARKLAFDGQREKARSICRTILKDGFNSDVALLMGRTFAWDGKYDSARIVLQNVLAQRPGSMEAYDALSDVEFWADNNEKAIDYCNAALDIEPESNSFSLKKARILYSNQQVEEAVKVLEDYLKRYPGQTDFVRKLNEYRVDLLKNNLKIIYTLDVFNNNFNRDPWQLLAISYARKTKPGTIIARANYARRFGQTGLQLELDAYPKISENNYVYLNYGFSGNALFPKNRYGAEWYHNFPHAFEGSLGIRLLDFSSSTVDIYTATFGKYIGNYWISLRSFLTPDSDGTSVSGFLSVHRYFSDAENYIGLKAGYGISPDDRSNALETLEKLTLKTRSVRAEYNHIFKKIWIFNAAAGLSSEELQPGDYAGYYTFDIGISRLF